MTKEPKVSELITMREAAQYCGRSHSQEQSYARSGQFRAWKVGMQWLTTEKELDRYLWPLTRIKTCGILYVCFAYRCISLLCANYV
jgi:hypothetical protein